MSELSEGMVGKTNTPFVDESGEFPTENSPLGGDKCKGSSDGDGRCERMGLNFDTIEEWNQHRRKHHPVGCSEPGCSILSAYKRDNSPYSYCFKHIPDEPETVYKWSRANTKSVVEPPKAEDHIIEQVLPEVDDAE